MRLWARSAEDIGAIEVLLIDWLIDWHNVIPFMAPSAWMLNIQPALNSPVYTKHLFNIYTKSQFPISDTDPGLHLSRIRECLSDHLPAALSGYCAVKLDSNPTQARGAGLMLDQRCLQTLPLQAARWGYCDNVCWSTESRSSHFLLEYFQPLLLAVARWVKISLLQLILVIMY